MDSSTEETTRKINLSTMVGRNTASISRNNHPTPHDDTSLDDIINDKRICGNELDTCVLSERQQEAFMKYKSGYNIFITGAGGSGKSEIIKRIYNDAKSANVNIQVTALTGCAAAILNCKGRTIHSWSGMGISNFEPEQMYERIKKNKYAREEWLQTDILIVDEVSMMSAKMLDVLNYVGKKVRKNSLPFGGIQVIFSGDFYQLPPIEKKEARVKFCFQSEHWSEIFARENHVVLDTVFRQADSVYRNILNDMRKGVLTRESEEILLTRVDILPEDSEIEPTKLFPVRYKVDEINKKKMNELTSESVFFELIQSKKTKYNISPQEIEHELKYLESTIICDSIIELKKNAQVMCVINIKDPDTKELIIYNGSQGIVVDFVINGMGKTVPVVKFNNGRTMVINYNTWESEKYAGISISQIPLVLCWAMTIHKTQGCSLDMAEIDIGSSIFECGQTYVALSRVRSLDGLFIKSFDPNKIRINKQVFKFYESLEAL